jgi:hypothetical protein
MVRYDKKAKKKPRLASEPKTSKQVKVQEYPESDARANFVWRVNDTYIDYGYSELGWCNCDSITLLKDIIKELQSYEGLTWQGIREASKHNHSWKFDRLPKELRDRLKERALGYLPELFQIKLACKPRIWGFKNYATFFLIWYDPEHTGHITKVK